MKVSRPVTRGVLLRLVVALSLLASLAAAVPARASGLTRLSGNVASWATSARLLGALAPNSDLTISVYLQLRDQAGLQTFLANLYRPGSSIYHHFLTPSQFHARYSPTTDEVAAVRDFLTRNGLRVENVAGNRTYIDATGTVAQVERAFRVTENLYRYQGMKLWANAQAPALPVSLASSVAFIGGLDASQRLVRPALPPEPNAPQPTAPPGPGAPTPGPCSTYWADHTATVSPPAYQYGSTFPWVMCGYTPAQLRAAYGVDKTGMTGAGVRIGIVDAFASTTILQDANAYSKLFGLPLLQSGVNFRQEVVPGTFNYPENHLGAQGWYGEETLDVEVAHAMAPAATIVYAGAQNNNVPLDHALIGMIDTHQADVISNSWGYNGEPHPLGLRNPEEQAFEQAAAEGISVLFASGDSGDVAAITGTAQASWPASSPFVTAVGGTSLGLQNASGAKMEWGWGTYTTALVGSSPTETSTSVTGTKWSPWPPSFSYGAGGGVSLNYPEPSYQVGVVPNALATTTLTASGQTITFSSPHRVVPDVAMDADPNTGYLTGETYSISHLPYTDKGCLTTLPTGVTEPSGFEYCLRRIGGTSLASPTFAGVVALADQARFAAHKGAIGFLNPVLYKGGLTGSALIDVLPPSSPTAVLRNFPNATETALQTRLRTINSVPVGTSGPVIEGADTSLRTTPGYDDVTGLGTPNAPAFVSAIAAH